MLAPVKSAVFPLLLLFALVLLTGSAAAQEVRVSEQAKLHFAVGVGLLEDAKGPRYAEAYESFRRAYKASPSPKILSNLGLCAMHIERDGEAIQAYELYLAQVDDIAPDERKRIEADLTRLRAGMATLVLSVRPVGAMIIDERIPETGDAIINRYQFDSSTVELGLRSGQHRVRVEAEGHKPVVFTAELTPGDKHLRKVRLVETDAFKKKKKKEKERKKRQRKKRGEAPKPSPEPEPEPDGDDEGGGISGPSIAMIAVTGALTVGAVVVGALALQAHADYDTYEDGGDRFDAENVRATGEALNIVTDVLIGTAAASAIVTIVLLATTSGGGDGGEESEEAAVNVTPIVAPGVGGGVLGVNVRF